MLWKTGLIGTTAQDSASLNPCFYGRYSGRLSDEGEFEVQKGLNPCFYGRYSGRAQFPGMYEKIEVLILVFMEDTLEE